jgi:hypothetical protein
MSTTESRTERPGPIKIGATAPTSDKTAQASETGAEQAGTTLNVGDTHELVVSNPPSNMQMGLSILTGAAIGLAIGMATDASAFATLGLTIGGAAVGGVAGAAVFGTESAITAQILSAGQPAEAAA